MKRRTLWLSALAALGAAAGGYSYVVGFAPRPRRIGMAPFTAVNERVMSGFKQALAERGWREGDNVEYRALPADGAVDQFDARLADLMAWKPDLVLAMSTPPSQAAYRATKASGTPMVFAPVSDPLAAGIVTSLARPGEQATGIRLLPSNGLRLQALTLVAPGIRKVYVPYSAADKSALVTLEQIRPAAQVLGLELLLEALVSEDDIARAARAIPPRADAVFLPQDSRLEARIDLFVAAAQARRLPLSAPSLLQVEQGALMTFGFDHAAIGRQAGRLAADILRGTPPGNLPVETAENGLYLNLRAARAIGLDIDPALLRQAKGLIR